MHDLIHSATTRMTLARWIRNRKKQPKERVWCSKKTLERRGKEKATQGAYGIPCQTLREKGKETRSPFFPFFCVFLTCLREGDSLSGNAALSLSCSAKTNFCPCAFTRGRVCVYVCVCMAIAKTLRSAKYTVVKRQRPRDACV